MAFCDNIFFVKLGENNFSKNPLLRLTTANKSIFSSLINSKTASEILEVIENAEK